MVKNDIAVLIGKKGKIANAIREVVSIAGRLDDKRVFVKFESFEDERKTKMRQQLFLKFHSFKFVII